MKGSAIQMHAHMSSLGSCQWFLPMVGLSSIVVGGVRAQFKIDFFNTFIEIAKYLPSSRADSLAHKHLPRRISS